MADHVTEAVRRLRELQEDVERLKADRDDDGEVRFLRDVDDSAAAGDVVGVGPDADVDDSTAAADTAETDVRTATPAVCDFDNADQSDAG